MYVKSNDRVMQTFEKGVAYECNIMLQKKEMAWAGSTKIRPGYRYGSCALNISDQNFNFLLEN